MTAASQPTVYLDLRVYSNLIGQCRESERAGLRAIVNGGGTTESETFFLYLVPQHGTWACRIYFFFPSCSFFFFPFFFFWPFRLFGGGLGHWAAAGGGEAPQLGCVLPLSHAVVRCNQPCAKSRAFAGKQCWCAHRGRFFFLFPSFSSFPPLFIVFSPATLWLDLIFRLGGTTPLAACWFGDKERATANTIAMYVPWLP